MDTAQFSKVKLTPNKLDSWIKFNKNVMLIGEKGCGKSTQIIDAFNRNKLKWVYFSGATLDPWTDLIGIPKPKELENGESIIEYIRPANLSDDVEAIFCDEFNRSHKKVKNALMELIQFKSTNGRKFPNLRFVWAAINPDTSDNSYDVDPVDPAQLDRFHVIVNIPYEPDQPYFTKKFSKSAGEQAIIWWNQQPALVKNLVSPRRLDYAIEASMDGLDISEFLPKCANIKLLKQMLTMNPSEVLFMKARGNNDMEALTVLLNDDKSFQELKSLIMTDEEYYLNVCNLMHNEKICALFEDYPKFADWIIKNPTFGKNKEIIAEKNKTRTFHAGDKHIQNIKDVLDTAKEGFLPKVKSPVKNPLIENTKSRMMELCNAANSLNIQLTHAQHQDKFKKTFCPLWLDFFTNKRHLTPLTKEEVNRISDYLFLIHNKVDNDGVNKLRIILKQIIGAYIEIVPVTFMNEDKIEFVLKQLNPKLIPVFDLAFTSKCADTELKDLNNLS